MADMNQRLYDETRIVIAKLELVSHGTTLNYDSDGRGGPSESKPPVTGHQRAPRKKGDPKALGDTEPEFLTLRRRLMGCRTDRDLKRVKHDAEQELVKVRRKAGTIQTNEQFRYWLIEKYADWAARDVADDMRGSVTAQQVRMIRRRADRNPDNGRERQAA